MFSLILSLVIIIGFGYIGWGIQNYYKNRIIFYENLDNMLHYIINNINFYKDSSERILMNFLKNSNTSKYLKSVIISFLKNNSVMDTLIIKKNEKSHLINIFNHLGKSDCENQIAGFKIFSDQTNFIIIKCKEEYEKIGKNATKLGILLGLAITICLL